MTQGRSRPTINGKEINGVMISHEHMLLRLALATVLGGLVGLERGRQEQAAGLRTHAMVAVGATLFTQVSAFGFAEVRGADVDPSRVAAQVVSGIGFLGAGAIIQQRQSVRGLTTAASIWAVAAIGLAVGGGLYLAAVSTTALMLFILALVKPVERRLYPHRRRNPVTLVMDRRAASLAAIEAAAHGAGARLERIQILPGEAPHLDNIELTLRGAQKGTLLALADRLRQVPGVQEITAVPEPGTANVRAKGALEPV